MEDLLLEELTADRARFVDEHGEQAARILEALAVLRRGAPL
jgi:hypothetical protein